MKRAIVFLSAILIGGATVASGATQIGLRGGWSDASGELFAGSGDPGGSGIYGVVVAVGLLPAIDLEFAYERYAKEFRFNQAAYEDTFFGGEADVDNQAYLLTGKLHVPLLGGPLGLYGGGGFSLHRLDLKVRSSDDSVGDYLDRVSGDRNEWEWHLVGGVQFKLPILPLLAYGEYRYQDVTGKDNPRYSSIYGGLNLFLR